MNNGFNTPDVKDVSVSRRFLQDDLVTSGDSSLPNPIQEYIDKDVKESTFLDLFEATEENVDLRTDIDIQEIVLINKIKIYNDYLTNIFGKDFKPYHPFINSYLRLKISNERRSRGEFVDINRKDRFEQNLQRFGNFQNLMKVKE